MQFTPSNPSSLDSSGIFQPLFSHNSGDALDIFLPNLRTLFFFLMRLIFSVLESPPLELPSAFLKPKYFPGIIFVKHTALLIVTSHLRNHISEWYKVDHNVAVLYTTFSEVQNLFPRKFCLNMSRSLAVKYAYSLKYSN